MMLTPRWYRSLPTLVLPLAIVFAACDGGTQVTSFDGDGLVVGTGADALVAPVTVEGAANVLCGDGEQFFSLKIEGDELKTGGSATDGSFTFTITDLSDDGTTIDWEATHPVSRVLIKGGSNGHNYYLYDGYWVVQDGLMTQAEWDATEFPGKQLSDTDLATPVVSGRPQQEISHVEVCYRYALEVDGSITPRFARTYEWDLTKDFVPVTDGPAGTDADPLLLSPGQTYFADFVLSPSVTGWTDSDFGIDGVITIDNPTPVSVDVETVVASLVVGAADPVAVDVTCEADLPVTLAAGASIECAFSHDLADGADGEVVVEATTSTAKTDPGDAVLPFTFEGADPTSEVNGTVDLVDDMGTPGDPSDDQLVAAVVHDVVQPVPFVVGMLFEECDDDILFDFVNTAWLQTQEAEPLVLATDDAMLYASVPCPPLGCTLTQGYWKTHNWSFKDARKGNGPPADDTWSLLDADLNQAFQAEGEPFWAAGTWYDVFWTAPKGNVFYILAKQYMAARLNVLNGASPELVEDALFDAESFFGSYTVEDAAGFRGQDRQSYVFMAQHLDAYNNGLLEGGPPHCDEDDTSSDID